MASIGRYRGPGNRAGRGTSLLLELAYPGTPSNCRGRRFFKTTVYLAQIYIPGLEFTIVGPFDSANLAASGQPYYALIGRTFLRHFNMAYEGRTGSVIISND